MKDKKLQIRVDEETLKMIEEIKQAWLKFDYPVELDTSSLIRTLIRLEYNSIKNKKELQ
jgi:hypothetical protein